MCESESLECRRSEPAPGQVEQYLSGTRHRQTPGFAPRTAPGGAAVGTRGTLFARLLPLEPLYEPTASAGITPYDPSDVAKIRMIKCGFSGQGGMDVGEDRFFLNLYRERSKKRLKITPIKILKKEEKEEKIFHGLPIRRF